MDLGCCEGTSRMFNTGALLLLPEVWASLTSVLNYGGLCLKTEPVQVVILGYLKGTYLEKEYFLALMKS